MNAQFAPALAAALCLCLPATAAARTADVRVVNTERDPVFVQLTGTPTVQLTGTPTVQLTGTPTVQLSGTPAVQLTGTPTVQVASSQAQPVVVQPARQPFQQFVSANSTAGEACEAVVVPAGKRLTIESFSAEANSSTEPNVFLRTAAEMPGVTSFRRSIQLALSNTGGSGWAGDVTTLLHSGPASDPTEANYSYSACVAGNGATANFSGFVSGWLE